MIIFLFVGKLCVWSRDCCIYRAFANIQVRILWLFKHVNVLLITCATGHLLFSIIRSLLRSNLMKAVALVILLWISSTSVLSISMIELVNKCSGASLHSFDEVHHIAVWMVCFWYFKLMLRCCLYRVELVIEWVHSFSNAQCNGWYVLAILYDDVSVIILGHMVLVYWNELCLSRMNIYISMIWMNGTWLTLSLWMEDWW